MVEGKWEKSEVIDEALMQLMVKQLHLMNLQDSAQNQKSLQEIENETLIWLSNSQLSIIE